MSDSNFRIHPAIGFARVGTSQDYYLAPETIAGAPGENGGPTGGLPIRKGEETQTIRASDLRDETGALKRQAARFRIFEYPTLTQPETYPLGTPGKEVQLGSQVRVNGATRTVKEIIWTVHVANKKAGWYAAPDEDGIIAWARPTTDPSYPKLRNQEQGDKPNDPQRWKQLFIDPGPRTIRGTDTSRIELDKATQASYFEPSKGITPLPNYPKTFPSDAFGKLYPPGVDVIQTLGALETDKQGRLCVIAGYGHANSFNAKGPNYGFDDPVNNDYWFDDTGDGPVDAALILDDGSTLQVEAGAWVVSTDPAYAPQIPNIVSLWDDVYDSWVRKLALRPELFSNGNFIDAYKPSFEDEIRPMFHGAGLQRWITNLSPLGIEAHNQVAAITNTTQPAATDLHGLGLIRPPVDPDKLTPFNSKDPNAIDPQAVAKGLPGRGDPGLQGDEKRMPLALGDAGRSLLSLTFTQFQYLKRWDRSADADEARIVIGPGELLDKAALAAGLGGRFSPGIDITYICREPSLYVQDWQTSGTGPFRVNPKPLSYAKAAQAPFLTLGWVPRQAGSNSLEPGDISKFMALPWQADYNSCGTHLPDPNLPMANTLYWSWPAQRPVAVYAVEDVKKLGGKQLPAQQRYSVRGPGTKTAGPEPQNPGWPRNMAEVGRYQKAPSNEQIGIIRILDNWMKIGTVIQATNIDDGTNYDQTFFLEVASQLSNNPEDSDIVIPWPNKTAPGASG